MEHTTRKQNQHRRTTEKDQTSDDAGQYQHDDVIKFIEQLKQVAKEQFNPLDKTKGMSKLFEKHQNTIINKATAFGVTVHVSLLIINLEANMEYTQSHEWGREFRVSGQAIRKKYPDYTYKHDQASYDDMVKEYAAAD